MSQHCQTKLPVTSFDASTCFSEVEWILLQDWQKELYSNVMNEIHQALMSLGPLIATTVVSLKAKEKENKRHIDSERWCTANNSQDATPFGLKGDGNQSLKHRFDAERRGSNDYLSTGQYALTSVKNNKRKDAYICDLGEFETKMDITVSSSESYPSVQPEILLRIEEEEELHRREWPVVEQSDICSRPTKGFSQLDADIGWRSLSEGKAFLVDPPRKNTEEHSTNQSAGLEVVSFTLKVEDEACSIDHRRVKDRGSSDSTAGVVHPELPRAVRRGQECAVSQGSEMKGFSQLDADIGWRSQEEGKAFLVDPPCKNREEHSTSPSAGLEVVSFILKEEDEPCSVDHRRAKDRDSTAGVVRPKLPRAVRMGQECAVSQVSEMKGQSSFPEGAMLSTSGEGNPPYDNFEDIGKGKERKRPPFEKEEQRVMMEGLMRNAEVLFGKKKRKTAMRVKNQIWDTIAEQVTAVGNTERTEAALKKRWQDLKVRVRKLVSEHKRASMALGGGSLGPLRLKPWEEQCRKLMDNIALEGVGSAEFEEEPVDNEPGTSGQSVRQRQSPPRKRKAVEPLSPPSPPHLPITTSTEGQAKQAVATTVPPSSALVVSPAVPTPVATAVPVTTTPMTQGTETLSLLPVLPSGPDPHVPMPATPTRRTNSDTEDTGDEQVLESDNTYSIPPVDEPVGGRGPSGDGDRADEFEDAMGEVLQCLQRLEELGQQPSAHDAQVLEAQVRQAKA